MPDLCVLNNDRENAGLLMRKVLANEGNVGDPRYAGSQTDNCLADSELDEVSPVVNAEFGCKAGLIPFDGLGTQDENPGNLSCVTTLG